jgi:hypothetical protein
MAYTFAETGGSELLPIGYLEELVCRSRSYTLVKLKLDIREAYATIGQDLLRRVFESFVRASFKKM